MKLSVNKILKLIKEGAELKFFGFDVNIYEYWSGENRFVETLSGAYGGASDYISQNKLKRIIKEVLEDTSLYKEKAILIDESIGLNIQI